jgi:hypothetical protein
MDEMDMILMQPSTDRDDILSPRVKIGKSFSFGSPTYRSLQPSPDSKRHPLTFHLLSDESNGGYMLSMSIGRLMDLRHALEEHSVQEIDPENACNVILSSASSSGSLSKSAFDSTMRLLVPTLSSRASRESKRILLKLLDDVYDAFPRSKDGNPNALEVACGFTVLCKGKKSDKLEFAFEVLDKNKRGRLSQDDTARYLKSFLSVLLCIAFSSALHNDSMDDKVTTMKGVDCDKTSRTIAKIAKAGAEWAASRAFDGSSKSLSFDDFADWYTNSGYSSVPWLELLDIQKWVFTSDTDGI